MLRFLKKYKYVMTIFLFMLIIFYIVFVKVNLKSKEKNLVDNQVVINEVEKVEVDLKDDLVYVDIKGAVKKPGVYKINSDKKIIDQTCPIMIQRLNNIFQRNPLISIGI